MEKMNLSAPWITFVHEVEALFKEDDEVHICYSNEDHVLMLHVNETAKAEALSQLMPSEKVFGNVTLKIEVIPPNKEMTKSDLIERAFFGNPALQYVYTTDSPFGKVSYAVFTNKVVQFFNDQMDDINGNKSMLFQDIAKDVLGTDHGVFYCTAAGRSDLTKPFGEWP